MSATFEIGAVSRGALHFLLRSATGEVLLTGRVHRSHAEVLQAVEHLRRSAALPTRFLRKKGPNDTHHFIVRDANGEMLAKSEIHSLAWERDWAIEEVMRHAPKGIVVANGPTALAPSLSPAHPPAPR